MFQPARFALVLVLLPGLATAEVHVINVLNNFFEDADTGERNPTTQILVGDTVRWVNPPDGPIPHNVTSTQFLSSPTLAAFEYEVTFENEGSFDYLCTIHPAQMFGTIEVNPLEQTPPLTINPGLNDAWFNPATNGQGFFINVFPDAGAIFVGWFTFETADRPGMAPAATVGEPFHRWLTAIGTWSENVATLDVFLTQDGIFDDPMLVDVSDAETYGTMMVEFEDCSNATVTYDLFAIGLSGMIPLQRIVPDNDVLCQDLSAAMAPTAR